MQERGGRDHAGEQTLDRFNAKMRIEISQRTVSEDQTDVETDERAAPPENKSHEAADRAVFFDTVAIVNPNKRKVLHIVKHFEQRDAHENANDDVVAVPPKRNARHEQRKFHRVWPLAARPHPDKIRQKKRGDTEGCEQHSPLHRLQ